MNAHELLDKVARAPRVDPPQTGKSHMKDVFKSLESGYRKKALTNLASEQMKSLDANQAAWRAGGREAPVQVAKSSAYEFFDKVAGIGQLDDVLAKLRLAPLTKKGKKHHAVADLLDSIVGRAEASGMSKDKARDALGTFAGSMVSRGKLSAPLKKAPEGVVSANLGALMGRHLKRKDNARRVLMNKIDPGRSTSLFNEFGDASGKLAELGRKKGLNVDKLYAAAAKDKMSPYPVTKRVLWNRPNQDKLEWGLRR